MTTMIKRVAPIAALLLFISSGVYAANNGGKDRNGGDRGNNRDNSEIWPRHENGCAIGNDPPPGANCTNRNDRN